MKTPFCYEFPRPAVAVDLIVVRLSNVGKRELLLIERGADPFKGCWALPGGFMEEGETLGQAAARELEEETGVAVDGDDLVQLEAYSDLDRDPRTRVISVVFFAVLEFPTEAKSGDDAADARWFGPDQLPKLAFDHDKIVADWDSMIRTWGAD